MVKVEQKEKKPLPNAVYALMMLAVAALWGASNALAKLGFDQITPIWCLVVRYFFAFFLFLAAFGGRFRANFKKADLKPAAIVSVFTAAAFMLGFLGLAHTSATNCGFLMSLAVVFAPLIALPLMKTKFEWRILLPVAIAAGGLFCFSGGSLSGLRLGDAYAILCSIASALMLVTSCKYLGEIDAIVLSVIQCAVCFFACLITAILFEPLPQVLSFSPRTWGILAYLVVGSTFLAYYFQNTALTHLSATFGAMVYCAEPIFTAIFAYFLLAERMSALGFAGAALIFIGIMLASLFEAKDKRTAADCGLAPEREDPRGV